MGLIHSEACIGTVQKYSVITKWQQALYSNKAVNKMWLKQ